MIQMMTDVVEADPAITAEADTEVTAEIGTENAKTATKKMTTLLLKVPKDMIM